MLPSCATASAVILIEGEELAGGSNPGDHGVKASTQAHLAGHHATTQVSSYCTMPKNSTCQVKFTSKGAENDCSYLSVCRYQHGWHI